MLYISSPSLFLLPLLSSAAQIPLKSSGSPSPFTSKFDSLVDQTLDKWKVPGLSIAVVDGNETFSKGYGFAAFPHEVVTPSTLFYTGSTTKSFTAAAVSLLIDDTVNSSHPLTWQTPLSSVIREDFVLPDEWTTSHVTLEDALSHRTGMPRHDLGWTGHNMTVRDVVRKLRYLPLTAEIRTKFQYCNLMYMAVSHFVETYTNTWLGDFLSSRIWKPLEMSNTFFSYSDANASSATGDTHLARGYVWVNSTQDYQGLSWLDGGTGSGAGSVISNVLDYSKWLRCMMGRSMPISPAGHVSLHVPRISQDTLFFQHPGFRGSDGYALGWFVSNYRGEVLMYHPGGLPGFATMMAYLPRMQKGVVMMSNSVEGGSVAHLILLFSLLDDVLDIPDDQRHDWESETENKLQGGINFLKHASDALYPNTPKGDDTIKLALPLDAYTGLYWHPAYPDLNLTIYNESVAYKSITETSTSPVRTKTDNQAWQHQDIIDRDPTNEASFPPFKHRHPDAKQPLHLRASYGSLGAYFSFTFNHITGEHFAVFARNYADHRNQSDFSGQMDFAWKAEFRIGEDGRVKELGVGMEPEMREEKIWFTKRQ